MGSDLKTFPRIVGMNFFPNFGTYF